MCLIVVSTCNVRDTSIFRILFSFYTVNRPRFAAVKKLITSGQIQNWMYSIIEIYLLTISTAVLRYENYLNIILLNFAERERERERERSTMVSRSVAGGSMVPLSMLCCLTMSFFSASDTPHRLAFLGSGLHIV